MPNLGTQWRPLFSANYLDVQVAAATPEEVHALARADLGPDRGGCSSSDRTSWACRPTCAPAPSRRRQDPIVYPVPGSRSRALGATGLTGIALTAVLVFWLERWRPRRRPAGARRPLRLRDVRWCVGVPGPRR